MPLSEHNWERFFRKQIETSGEKKENQDFELPKEVSEDMKTKLIKINPKNCHQIACRLLPDENFKNILKEFIAEKIVRKELFTRMDKLIKIKNTKDYIKLYGFTYRHFEDIENGNLSSFDLVEDDKKIAITFKRILGHSSLRYIDDKILVDILNDIFASRPEFSDTINFIAKKL